MSDGTRIEMHAAADIGMVDRLARIETKLDMLVDTRTLQDARISKLEKFAWVAAGLGASGGVPQLANLAQSAGLG